MKYFLGIMTIAFALQAQEFNRFSFNVGGGFTNPVGNTGRQLDDGWNIGVGAGMNLNPWVGAIVQADFNSLGINNTTLNNVGFPGGDVHVFSATLDPIVHLTPHRKFDAYIIGGGGIYHYYQQFTAPTVGTVGGFNPFFGFYSFDVPATQILQSYSVNKPGVNIGMGIALGTKFHGKVYAEARYDHIYMGNDRHVDYVPVTVGFRW